MKHEVSVVIEKDRSGFYPRLDALGPAQRHLWSRLASTPSSFVLYGDTALALRLGHRASVDFDFFSSSSFQPDALDTVAEAALAVYRGALNPLISLKALTYFDEGDVRALSGTDRQLLADAVRALDPSALSPLEIDARELSA